MSKSLTVSEQASVFVTRLYSGEMSEQEEQAFYQWIEASSEHQQAYQQQLDIWHRSQDLANHQKPAFLTRWWTLAAVALLTLFGGYYVSHQTVESMSSQHYVSAIGEVSHLTLNDGTQVVLNTNTRINVSYSNEQRYIELLQGQAYFDVVKDQHRPLLVDAGTRNIRVLGTKFSVTRQSSRVAVAVTEGLVAVSKASATTASNEGDQYKLSPGQKGHFSDKAEVVTNSSVAEIESQLSWRQGSVIIKDGTLLELVELLNQHSTKAITIADKPLESVRISGVFNVKQQAAILQSLQTSLDVNIRHTQQGVVIYAKDEANAQTIE